MPFIKALTLSFLLACSPLSAYASAEAEAAPCEECDDMAMPVVTTTSKCSLHPYTSGGHTYLLSTTTITEKAHCTKAAQGYCENDTITKTIHGHNTDVAPVSISIRTRTVEVPTTITSTITSYHAGRVPDTVTQITTAKRATETVTISDKNETTTIYKTHTSIDREVRTRVEVSTKTVGGKVVRTETITLTKTPKKVPTGKFVALPDSLRNRPLLIPFLNFL